MANPVQSASAYHGVVVRNTFVDVPDSPKGGSDDDDGKKSRFLTCPELSTEESSSLEPGLEPELAAATPPVLLGSMKLPTQRSTVKNGFVHVEDEDVGVDSPVGGKMKSKTWQAAPRSPLEDSDEELESTPCVQDMPSPAFDDDTPRSSMWRNSRCMDTQELQEDAWASDGYNPYNVNFAPVPRPVPLGFAGGGPWEQPPPSIEHAMSMAQGALGALEAAENEPPEAAEQERGSSTVNLYGNLQQSPSEQPVSPVASPYQLEQPSAEFATQWAAAVAMNAAALNALNTVAMNAAVAGAMLPPAAGMPWGAFWPGAAGIPGAPPAVLAASATQQAAPSPASPNTIVDSAANTTARGETPSVLKLASLTGPPPPPPLHSNAVLQAEREAVDAAAGAQAPNRKSSRKPRLWAHIYLHMQGVPEFDLVPRLIGRGGCNMKKISEETKAKIRVRGQGSGHLEENGRGGPKAEAPTPLMVAVTTDFADGTSFKIAVGQIVKVLQGVEQKFRAHCLKKNHVHEGPCYSQGLVPDDARQVLGALLQDIPEQPPTSEAGRRTMM